MIEYAGRCVRILDDEDQALACRRDAGPGKGGEMSAPSQVYSAGISPPGANAGVASIKGTSRLLDLLRPSLPYKRVGNTGGDLPR